MSNIDERMSAKSSNNDERASAKSNNDARASAKSGYRDQRDDDEIGDAVLADIAERLHSAWDVLKRLPDTERGRLRMASMHWPMMVRRLFEDAPRGTPTRRPPPSARDIDQMDEALDWMVALAKDSRDYAKVVWAVCALRLKIGRVAKELGVHRDTARKWRDNGLARIAVKRNSSTTIRLTRIGSFGNSRHSNPSS